MMSALAQRGHEVAILCGLSGEGALAIRHRIALKLSRSPLVRDTSMGYPAYRAWSASDPQPVKLAVDHFSPDVVIVQCGEITRLVQRFQAHGVPTMLYFHNVEFSDLDPPLNELDSTTTYISNSAFTREWVHREFGLDSTVILPLIDPKLYRTQSTHEKVVFINPHPLKGVDTAIAMAEACPEIPFVFVESWTLSAEQRAKLVSSLRALPNVEWRHPTNDISRIYACARIVIAPSIWEETFGRVVAEGQISGIPAIASNLGGLPEATGPGGILISPDAPIDEWISALKRLWYDPEVYRDYAKLAYKHAMRPELECNKQISALEFLMKERLSQITRTDLSEATPNPARRARPPFSQALAASIGAIGPHLLEDIDMVVSLEGDSLLAATILSLHLNCSLGTREQLSAGRMMEPGRTRRHARLARAVESGKRIIFVTSSCQLPFDKGSKPVFSFDRWSFFVGEVADLPKFRSVKKTCLSACYVDEKFGLHMPIVPKGTVPTKSAPDDRIAF